MSASVAFEERTDKLEMLTTTQIHYWNRAFVARGFAVVREFICG